MSPAEGAGNGRKLGRVENYRASNNHLPAATVERLPRYLRLLEQKPEAQATISSTELAAGVGMNAAGVRKDLSRLGSYGKPGTGYYKEELTAVIRRRLGLTEDRPVAVMGAGNLGSALAGYGGFARRGFRIVGLYDAAPGKIGTVIGGITVRPVENLAVDAARVPIAVGIIATPAAVAQEVADLLAAAGVSSILNFAPAALQVPSGIHLRQVDLATELQILSYHLAG